MLRNAYIVRCKNEHRLTMKLSSAYRRARRRNVSTRTCQLSVFDRGSIFGARAPVSSFRSRRLAFRRRTIVRRFLAPSRLASLALAVPRVPAVITRTACRVVLASAVHRYLTTSAYTSKCKIFIRRRSLAFPTLTTCISVPASSSPAVSVSRVPRVGRYRRIARWARLVSISVFRSHVRFALAARFVSVAHLSPVRTIARSGPRTRPHPDTAPDSPPSRHRLDPR